MTIVVWIFNSTHSSLLIKSMLCVPYVHRVVCRKQSCIGYTPWAPLHMTGAPRDKTRTRLLYAHDIVYCIWRVHQETKLVQDCFLPTTLCTAYDGCTKCQNSYKTALCPRHWVLHMTGAPRDKTRTRLLYAHDIEYCIWRVHQEPKLVQDCFMPTTLCTAYDGCTKCQNSYKTAFCPRHCVLHMTGAPSAKTRTRLLSAHDIVSCIWRVHQVPKLVQDGFLPTTLCTAYDGCTKSQNLYKTALCPRHCVLHITDAPRAKTRTRRLSAHDIVYCI